MKQTHGLRILLCILVCACTARLATGQQVPAFTAGETAIIKMKSGDKFEGKILRDAPDSVEIEYKLTPKIKDKKVLLKSDMAEVKKQSASETEFAERGLGKLLPTADLMTASEYESIIQDKLRTFVAKYPGTPEAAEVEKIIATLGEEKSKVVSGQMKVEGRWLDAASVKRDAYNIEAYRQYLAMKARAAENKDARYLEALRAFEKLRSDYSASSYFLKAIPEAQEILKKFEVQLTEMAREAPILKKRRDDGLKQLPANEVPVARKAIEDEEKAYRDLLARQSSKDQKNLKDKTRWHEFNKFDEAGLKDLLLTLGKERADLAAVDVAAMQADSDALMAVIRYLADKNVAEAGTAYEKVQKLTNPAYRPLIQDLSKQLFALREAAKKEQKAVAAPASAESPTAPSAEGSGANPVAEAMKKIQEAKDKKGTPGGDTKPNGGATAKPTTAPAAPAAAPAPEPAPSLMDKLNDYLPLIGGGLVAVILVAWLMGKRKKDKE